MKPATARKILKLFGWTFNEGNSPDIERCVMILAPHTSIWDFVIGRLSVWILGIPAKILVKKEFFRFPLGRLLRKLGAIPVDRGNRKNNIVSQAVQHFRDNEKFTLILTPEGTRKYTKRWKHGFYDIATAANVPIVLTYIDYKKKQAGVGVTFTPTGDYETDIIEIQNFYKNITAKYPKDFNMSEMYWQNQK